MFSVLDPVFKINRTGPLKVYPPSQKPKRPPLVLMNSYSIVDDIKLEKEELEDISLTDDFQDS